MAEPRTPRPALFDEGPWPPCPAPFNMAAHTFAVAEHEPERTALEVLAAPEMVSGRWTHGELREAVLRTAGGLAGLGVGRASRVMLRLGNSADLPILFFAANALGAVPVPTSPQLTPGEVAAILDDLAPDLICLGDGLGLPEAGGVRVLGAGAIAALRAAPPVGFAATEPGDPAFIVYTSGTGGVPKGVVHAQRAAWARRMMWDGWYGLRRDDRVLHAGAFNWTYTLGAGLTDPWAIGAAALIHAGPPDRDVWPRLAAAHGATIFAAVPGVYRQMLRGGDLAAGFRHLRHGLSAGEAMPEAVAEAWGAATGKPIFEALGMSEVSTYVSFSPGRPPVAGRAGVPQPGRRVAILDDAGGEAPLRRGEDGVLAVSRRDPGLMLGYWRRPDDTAAAFRGEWFVTGDRARMHDDGTIGYLGRADDVMNAGGFRVSPVEVEAAVLSHPGIGDAAAVEWPVGPETRVIAVFYVPEDEPIDADVLGAHCAGRLARFKCPRVFHAVDALPRGTNGKLIRRRLLEAAAE